MLQSCDSVDADQPSSSASADTMRWHNQLDDSDEESRRIDLYKHRRRERYRHMAQSSASQTAASQNKQRVPASSTGLISRIALPPGFGVSTHYTIGGASISGSSVLYKPVASVSKISAISC